MSNKIRIKPRVMRCTLDDANDVQRILTHESVFSTAKDDNPADTSQAAVSLLSDPSKYVLRPRTGTIFIFIPINYVTYDTHIAIIDGDGRKHGSRSFLRAGRWMFKNTTAQKLFGYIPEPYKGAEAMVRSLGGVEEGRLTKSFLHSGILYDMVMIGITKQRFIEIYGEV